MAKNDTAKKTVAKSTIVKSTTKNDTASSRKGTVEAGDGTVTVRLVKGLRGTKSIHRLSVKALARTASALVVASVPAWARPAAAATRARSRVPARARSKLASKAVRCR